MKLKKVLVGLLLMVMVIFFLLNPSTKSFQEFLGKTSSKGLRKTGYYMVCLKYENEATGKKYLGVFMNFFPIHSKSDDIRAPVIDSTGPYIPPYGHSSDSLSK